MMIFSCSWTALAKKSIVSVICSRRGLDNACASWGKSRNRRSTYTLTTEQLLAIDYLASVLPTVHFRDEADYHALCCNQKQLCRAGCCEPICLKTGGILTCILTQASQLRRRSVHRGSRRDGEIPEDLSFFALRSLRPLFWYVWVRNWGISKHRSLLRLYPCGHASYFHVPPGPAFTGPAFTGHIILREITWKLAIEVAIQMRNGQ